MIEITDLYKYYGEGRAIGPVNATINEGEVVGLLGLNGAGKTTTLRILACDLLPSGGVVRIDGQDIVDSPEGVKAKTGYLPDRPPLYDDLRVDECLEYAARLRGVPGSEVARAVDEAKEKTGLTQKGPQLVGTLSHGYRQRLGIAQAIVHRPRLVILDEPIAGLDPSQIVEVRRLVRSLGGDHTVLISSHILSEVSETCDRLLIIQDGVIVASGTEADLSSRFRKGLRVRVAASGLSPQAGVDLLGGLEGIVRVTPEPLATDGADSAFVVEAEADVRSELARAVVGAGHDLIELRREESDLEDIFLRLSRMAHPKERKSPPPGVTP